MTFEEAKEAIKAAGTLYRAYSDGEVWSAGRMVAAGETIGYYTTEKEAREACAEYELFDFDKTHMATYVDEVNDDEFAD